MATFYKYNFFLFLIIIINSCNSETKNAAVDISKNEIKTNTITKSPDPSIAVKEDFSLLTQSDEEREDKSHMDMSYFPSNYALEKALHNPISLNIRVTYSRPRKGTRPQIFGDSSVLVPYGKLWRLGANETTEIEFLKPVIIEGKKINPGRYSMYAIPYKDYWTIIINSEIFTFGDFNYNEAKDIVKAKATVTSSKFNLELLIIYFQKTNTGCNLIIGWDNVLTSLPITII